VTSTVTKFSLAQLAVERRLHIMVRQNTRSAEQYDHFLLKKIKHGNEAKVADLQRQTYVL
jgi:hypothetical protein